jgi:hypothetical protein
MHKGKYVFSQILSLFNRYEFDKCVKRYDGNKGVRDFTCWNQFVHLFFGQLTGRNGLRDIVTCLDAHSDKLYHLGIPKKVHFSSLSRANEQRDWRIFSDYGYYLIRLVKPLYVDEKVDENLPDELKILALDSTTISTSIKLCNWALGKYSKGAVKVHALLDLKGHIPEFIHISDGKYHDVNALDEITFSKNSIYVMDKAYIDFKRLFELHKDDAFFVVRAKTNLNSKAVKSLKSDKNNGIKCDQYIKLQGVKTKKLYTEKIRRIKYYDQEKQITLVFLTNNFELTAMEICAIYKSRWQIEIFFKWIKQNLQIKTLWGYSENAVKIHIWIAICTYLIIAYLKKELKSPLTIYEIMQILGISVFDKTPVNQLITKTIKKDESNNIYMLFNMNDL